MKSYSTRSVFPTGWILTMLLLGVSGGFQPVWAVSESASIDSLKSQIKLLVQDKKYGQAAKSYENLGWLYHQRYGYNKYTMDSYFNGLKYYNLIGDSLGYYNEHLVIGDYYTHDYFMQPYALKYLRKAQQYFERTHNMPKVIECRLGLANIAQKKSQYPAICWLNYAQQNG